MTTTFEEASAEFRQHLPDLSIPRFTVAKEQNAYEYVDDFKKNQHPPWIYNLTEAWKHLLEEPFQGVTSDGEYYALKELTSFTLTIVNRSCPARSLQSARHGY